MKEIKEKKKEKKRKKNSLLAAVSSLPTPRAGNDAASVEASVEVRSL
jgi:hypothetical protein